ncbi:MAG: hypothetical protein ACSHYB_07005 [Roseibacillus sp.]
MKLLLFFTLTLGGFLHSEAQDKVLENYDPILNEIENFDPADLKTMMEMDPPHASLFFLRLTFDYNLRLPEAAPYREALGQELFKHPQLEDYFIKRFKETPRHYDTAEKIKWVWGPLTLMRYSWAVRLLGEEVMDDTLMTQPGATEAEIDMAILNRKWTLGENSFQTKSIYALAHLHLPNAPFDETSPKIRRIRPNVVEEWKTWYVKHGAEVIAQLEAEEAERAELEAQAIAVTEAKRHLNLPRSPPVTIFSSTQEEETKATSPQSALLAAIILLAISLIVYLTLRLRRSKTP